MAPESKTSAEKNLRDLADPEHRGRRADPIPTSRYFIFGAILLVGLVADLVTKSWIFSKLWPPTADKPQYLWLWPGHVGLQVSLNEGAVFGIGQGMVLWFALLSVVAVVGILYWLFFLGEARSLWLTIALGGITAGILGNLYDRVGMHGLVWPSTIGEHQRGTPIYAVRDWILLQWDNQLRWPNFNIADSLLVVGALSLLLHAYLSKRHQSRAEDPQDPKQSLSAEPQDRR